MRVKPKAARQPHEATASGMSASDPEHQSIHEAADGYKAACVTMPVWTGQALASSPRRFGGCEWQEIAQY